MKNEIAVYNKPNLKPWDFIMAKRKQTNGNDGKFGKRMAAFRKAAGLSQRDLAKELGITQRMIAYYEAETKYPPAHILAALADALETSTDELLGREPVKTSRSKSSDTRLWKRFTQLQKLPTKKRKNIINVIDMFIKSEEA
ncbi:MAG: helix-turn-helix transcriptional regulator [Deltaproteobacteria bacterium]|nr:helix-turn-helix transcriptional regulator [Deltaproteobacteria bacterium]